MSCDQHCQKIKTTYGYDAISVFIEIAQLPQLPLIELAHSALGDRVHCSSAAEHWLCRVSDSFSLPLLIAVTRQVQIPK